VIGPQDGLVAAVESMVSASIALTARTLAATPGAAELTLSQWRLLALASRTEAGMRLGALANAAGMSPPSASRMLARLAARGLVASARDSGDRRAVGIAPTDQGRHVVAAVLAERARLIERAVARARPDPTFAPQLERLVHALVQEDPDEDRARRATDGGDPAPPLRRHRTGRGGPRRRVHGAWT
jgi:DNA-binding MarR family transcriptional regulator